MLQLFFDKLNHSLTISLTATALLHTLSVVCQMRSDAVKEMILQTVADKGPQNVQDIADMLESVPIAVGKDIPLLLSILSVSI